MPDALSRELNRLFSRITAFLDEVGPKTGKRLGDMARSRNGDVFVIGVKFREGMEEGRRHRERSTVRERLGSIKGSDVLLRESYLSLHVSVSNFRSAFSAAAQLGEKPSKGVIEDLAGKLDRYEHVIREVNLLLALERQFMTSPMLLLCFLVDDRAERPKCARVAMHQIDVPGGKDHAKKWLADQEVLLLNKFGMDKLEIA